MTIWLPWAAYALLLIFLFVLYLKGRRPGPAVGGKLVTSQPVDQPPKKE